MILFFLNLFFLTLKGNIECVKIILLKFQVKQ